MVIQHNEEYLKARRLIVSAPDVEDKNAQYAAAFNILDQLSKTWPEEDYFLPDLAYVLMRLDKYSEAIMALDRAEELGNLESALFSLRGEAKARLARYDEAIDDLMVALYKRPEEALHYIDIGEVLKKQQHSPNSVAEWFEVALLLDPTNETALQFLETYSYHLPKHSENSAKRHLVKADTDYKNAINLIKEAMHSNSASSKYSMALDLLEAAAKRFPNNGYVLINMAYALSGLERHKDAIAAIDQAISIGHDAPAGYFLRGQSKESLAQYYDAIDDYLRALYLSPKDASTYSSIGFCIDQIGDTQWSKKWYQAALCLSPNDDAALNFFEQNNL